MEAFKKIAGEERASKLRVNMGYGRIFYERTLLAERAPGSDTPSRILPAIDQVFPDVTETQILDKMPEVMDERARPEGPMRRTLDPAIPPLPPQQTQGPATQAAPLPQPPECKSIPNARQHEAADCSSPPPPPQGIPKE